MFGKPEWFCKKTVGWGLSPVSWKGWFYVAAWIAVICLPFIALLWIDKVPESLIWVVAAMGTLLWDVRRVVRELGGGGKRSKQAEPVAPETGAAESIAQKDMYMEGDPDSEVFVIDENTRPDPSYFNTKSYDFHLRR